MQSVLFFSKYAVKCLGVHFSLSNYWMLLLTELLQASDSRWFYIHWFLLSVQWEWLSCTVLAV